MGLESNYASWESYFVKYNPKKKSFTLGMKNNKKAITSFRVADILVDGKSIGDLSIFKKLSTDYVNWGKTGELVNHAFRFKKGTDEVPSLTFKFVLGYKGIELTISSKADCTIICMADLLIGDGTTENTYPITVDKKSSVIRCASGPAASEDDNMLFDRISDDAIKFDGVVKPRMKYDWERKTYCAELVFSPKQGKKKTLISLEEKVLSNEYHFDYVPTKKRKALDHPAVGWMTWYSVKFNACEEIVLKNAKWMAENLKDYGAECIWVDWEWVHKDFTGSRDDGTDFFHPDKERYPHGLKYVSDKIKEMGLTPALWIGFTNESTMTDFMKENPDMILADIPTWCGRYFFDFTNPKYLEKLLPDALKCADNWGYDIIKYDTLPSSMTNHDRFHSNMKNPSLTSKEAYRKMVKKTREVLGEDRYMLSCSGSGDRMVLWAGDIFDAARVGGDIFKWEEFKAQGVDLVLKYYPLHNNLLHLDCDNVVMREEFNNLTQAASRISFVSMLGLPVTIGDEFDALDEARINLIKQCIPVLDVHSTNAVKGQKSTNITKINLAIERKWESYNVVNVFNTTDKKAKTKLNFYNDLSLEEGKYLVFDYSKNEFLGVIEKELELALDACETKILSVRKKKDTPQIISTSRHISQGATEISSVEFKNNTLSVKAELIANIPYTITLYVPEGYKTDDLEKVNNSVYKKTVTSEKGGINEINICF